jgi:hypothetical protein
MKMKTFAIVLGCVTLAVALVAVGVWIGVTFSGGPLNAGPLGWPMMGSGMMGGNWSWDGQSSGKSCAGLGMMGLGWDNTPCGQEAAVPGSSNIVSLEDAKAAVERYVDRLGYTGLEVSEVMGFERNLYAIVAEEDTGIGAMELLIDRSSGAVGPEPGPNMMWNAKYGMHRRGGMMGMMGGYATGEMTLSPVEAEQITQRWLDVNLPGRTTGEADAFYGYYTFHFVKDGEIEGMLSVHGATGDVWYHSWHGSFIAMIGEEETSD